MTVTDFKVYALNSFAFVFSMGNYEVAAKLLLILVTIGYTIHKWFLLSKGNKDKEL
jgi:hypothetical protein